MFLLVNSTITILAGFTITIYRWDYLGLDFTYDLYVYSNIGRAEIQIPYIVYVRTNKSMLFHRLWQGRRLERDGLSAHS